MGNLKVIAGDFQDGGGSQLKGGYLHMRVRGRVFPEKISLDQITELDIASEESVRRIGGAIGWGIAGEVLLGPVGLLVGLLRGGKRNETTFVCKLRDGRKFLGVAPSKAFSSMRLALLRTNFSYSSTGSRPPALSEEEEQSLPSQDVHHPGSMRGYTLTGKLAPKPKKNFYQRKRWRAVGLFFGFIFVIVVIGQALSPSSPTSAPVAVHAPQPFNVTIKTTNTGGNRPIIVGETNLPDGTQMIVSIEKRHGPLLGQQNITVADGHFQAGPFSDGDNSYRPGSYVVEISTSLAALQPQEVQAIIGSNGQYMLGSSVVNASIGTNDKVIDDLSTFKIP